MKLNYILGVIAFSFACSVGNTQTLVGAWKGNINAGGNQLPLVFHLKQINNQWEGTHQSKIIDLHNIPLLFHSVLL